MDKKQKDSFMCLVEDLESELRNEKIECKIGLKHKSDYGLDDGLFKFKIFTNSKHGDFIDIKIECIELNEYKDSIESKKKDILNKILQQIKR